MCANVSNHDGALVPGTGRDGPGFAFRGPRRFVNSGKLAPPPNPCAVIIVYRSPISSERVLSANRLSPFVLIMRKVLQAGE